MNEEEKPIFVDRLVELALAFGAELPADRIRVFVKLLGEYQLAHLEKACSYFERAGCARYFPTVPEFHASVGRIRRDEEQFSCMCCRTAYVFDQVTGSMLRACACVFDGDFWCATHQGCRECCGCKSTNS